MRRKMDCRVKPGNDDRIVTLERTKRALLCSRNDPLRPRRHRRHHRLLLLPLRRVRHGRRDDPARRAAQLFRRRRRHDPVLDHPDRRQRLARRAMAALRALADLPPLCARRRHRLRSHVRDRLRPQQGDGLSLARADPVRGRDPALLAAPEHRVARGAVRDRHSHHDHPGARRRRRALSRYLLPEEHARSQDHQRHQGDRAVAEPRGARRLFRLARGLRRRASRSAWSTCCARPGCSGTSDA